MNKGGKYIIIAFSLAVLIVLAMHLEHKALYRDEFAYRTEEPEHEEIHHEVRELLSDTFLVANGEFYAKTLYEGDNAEEVFKRYRSVIVGRLGKHPIVRRGKPPFNDGAFYAYWEHNRYRIRLALRAVSDHYRSQGHTPIVDFEVRTGGELNF